MIFDYFKVKNSGQGSGGNDRENKNIGQGFFSKNIEGTLRPRTTYHYERE
jgi:hypothetical protein